MKTFSVCALMLGVALVCGCAAKAEQKAKVANTVDARCYTYTTPPTLPCEVANDTSAVQLGICESVLDECAKTGILDAKGVKAYKGLKKRGSVYAYIELIAECENEENFFDTVGEMDLYENYVLGVLAPRGLAD